MLSPGKKAAATSPTPRAAAARSSRDLALHNAHPRLKVPSGSVHRAIALLDATGPRFLGGCPPGELSLAFLTDSALARIHGDFMDDPTVTDVITFEGDRAAGLAGEVCVSADTAARYVGLPAGARPPATIAWQNRFARELMLYVVHGWLHLAGYDDLQPAKKRRMRAAEARAMQLLADHHAIPAFRLK